MAAKEAFTELFNENYDRIYVVAYTYCKDVDLAKDITQHVFIKTLWERITDVAAMESPLGWMCSTARFAIINKLTQQVATRQYLDNWLERNESKQENPASLLEEKLLEEKDPCCAVTTTRSPARVYLLSREEGLTYEEIAGRLKIGKETVKEHMARALKSLRSLFDYRIWLIMAIRDLFFNCCPPKLFFDIL